MRPLVSILIPTYNREKLVRECIASAQAQTYQNIEIIVCDNASTDATWAVIQDLARQDSRIRAFRNESNVGPVRNWLRCLEHARGEYTKILFSDDLIAPNYLERLVPALQNPQVAFAYSAAYLGPAMGQGQVVYRNGVAGTCSCETYFALLSRCLVPFSPGAALFRTNDVRQNLRDILPTKEPRDFWKHGAGPDVMLYALTARAYPLVAVDEEPLVLFRAHADSITVSNANNQVIDGYRAALGWFFMTFLGRPAWTDYIARQWLFHVVSTRAWCGIAAFARRYEGSGAKGEAFGIIRSCVAVLFRRLAQGAIQSVGKDSSSRSAVPLGKS